MERGNPLTAMCYGKILKPIRGIKKKWNGRGNQAFYSKQKIVA